MITEGISITKRFSNSVVVYPPDTKIGMDLGWDEAVDMILHNESLGILPDIQVSQWYCNGDELYCEESSDPFIPKTFKEFEDWAWNY